MLCKSQLIVQLKISVYNMPCPTYPTTGGKLLVNYHKSYILSVYGTDTTNGVDR